MTAGSEWIGVIVIGRNEGDRLVRCLHAVTDAAGPVTYVDSGSTDGSVERARKLGADVVILDASIPFTAARARNAGFARLVEWAPDIEYVQFIDGDCELVGGWLEDAAAFLEHNDDVGVVCGRRRERFPEASPFNRLVDMEWDTPAGNTESCGGDALFRVTAFRDAGGYDQSLIAGEDPELCLRVCRAGYRIVRLEREMTMHDAAIYHFHQWWRRTVRAGHAVAELAWMHGRGSERYMARQVGSICFWGAAIPLAALGFAVPTGGTSVALFGAYGVLWARVCRHRLRQGDKPRHATLYASATAIGKLAEMGGVIRFAWTRVIRRRRSKLIEYKGIRP